MSTQQIYRGKRKMEDVIERFASPKAEDPLIKYWIQRKIDFEIPKKEKKKDKRAC